MIIILIKVLLLLFIIIIIIVIIIVIVVIVIVIFIFISIFIFTTIAANLAIWLANLPLSKRVHTNAARVNVSRNAFFSFQTWTTLKCFQILI